MVLCYKHRAPLEHFLGCQAQKSLFVSAKPVEVIQFGGLEFLTCGSREELEWLNLHARQLSVNAMYVSINFPNLFRAHSFIEA